MGTFSGLSAFSDALAPYESRPKAKWFTLENGQSVKVRFVSEIDPDSRFYNEDRGLVLLATEHVSPNNYKIKALCTRETEGRCWACEEAARNPRTGWGVKRRAYFNVIVDDGKTDPYVAIWQLSVGPRSTNAKVLQTYASTSGGISGNPWTVTRSGTGKDTNYIMMPGIEDADTFDWGTFAPYDLEEYAVRSVSYADQQSHFSEESVNSFSAPKQSSSSDNSDDIW